MCCQPRSLVIDLRFGVICRDQQITFQAAFCTQTRFQFIHQPGTDAHAAKRRGNRQVIDQPAAAIKATDHRANNGAIRFCNEEQVRVTGQFLFNLGRRIGTAGMDTFLDALPQRKYRLIIGREAEFTNSNGGKSSWRFVPPGDSHFLEVTSPVVRIRSIV